jgi:calcium/calmodulin-dependent protein kinase I
VLLEKPYNKAVDLWGIGIITYLLLCSCLPFDHETSEKEIARQTVNNATPFPTTIWSKLSIESKDFVDSISYVNLELLQKEPVKRLNIKEVLEHSWLQKFGGGAITQKRRMSKTGDANFIIYSCTVDMEKK